MPNPDGRPPVWTPDNPEWPIIFREIAEGSTIRNCLHPVKPNRPSIQRFYDCLKTYPDINEHYVIAREIKTRILLDDIDDIAKDDSDDRYVDEKGITRIDNSKVQRSRLITSVRQWRAEKELPNEYGNRVAVDHNLDINISMKDSMLEARSRLDAMPIKTIERVESDQIVTNSNVETGVLIESVDKSD